MNVSQDELLIWNSSMEMIDKYVAYLTLEHKQLSTEKICNCSSRTFGKFCKYQFMIMNTFEDTIDYQFHLKRKYRNGSQLCGNITCYTTLNDCYYSLRCLAWQNICDGKQQCMDGIDEDHCEELEYNECQENEYRCDDDSCIAEQYWLDGEFDCLDISNEQEISEHEIYSQCCPLTSSDLNCDEITAHFSYFACGDGHLCLTAIASIQRHILIFNNHWLLIHRRRLIVHYIPLIFCIFYPSTFYLIFIYFYPCEMSTYDYVQYCSYPCYSDNLVLYTIDYIVHTILPVIVIIIANITLICRVIHSMQKIRQCHFDIWKRQKKVTLQLIVFSSLYIIGWDSVTVVSVIQMYFMLNVYDDIPEIYYITFSIYFICTLQSIICLFTLPELMNYIKKKLKQILARETVAPVETIPSIS
ncbi:unnamed protein product [Rotaria sp. Silwood2]|nr:unnamed protein product [Rotaria sp. Silwood2]CAF4341054.1 unnamed protein product [Rotaria sp. Silwood2]